MPSAASLGTPDTGIIMLEPAGEVSPAIKKPQPPVCIVLGFFPSLPGAYPGAWVIATSCLICFTSSQHCLPVGFAL